MFQGCHFWFLFAASGGIGCLNLLQCLYCQLHKAVNSKLPFPVCAFIHHQIINISKLRIHVNLSTDFQLYDQKIDAVGALLTPIYEKCANNCVQTSIYCRNSKLMLSLASVMRKDISTINVEWTRIQFFLMYPNEIVSQFYKDFFVVNFRRNA